MGACFIYTLSFFTSLCIFFCVIMSNYLFFTVFCKRYKPSSVPFVKLNTNFSNHEQQWNKTYIQTYITIKKIKGLDRVNSFFFNISNISVMISVNTCTCLTEYINCTTVKHWGPNVLLYHIIYFIAVFIKQYLEI